MGGNSRYFRKREGEKKNRRGKGGAIEKNRSRQQYTTGKPKKAKEKGSRTWDLYEQNEGTVS